MSLRVWLPLNGNLNNQGLSDITVTNSGATVDNNGKIGKCYYFDGNAHYLQFSKSVGDLYSGDFSYAVWLKPIDDTRSVICSEYASSGASNIAFELSASRQVRLYWNGSPDISSTGCILPKSQWTHIVITRSGNEAKFYMNGELKYTYTGTLSNRTSTAKIRLGDDYRGGTGVSYMGYMNDFRIYDHALSPKEVEILSRGLVCHYPLNGNGRGGDNLLTNTSDLTKWTIESGISVTWDADKGMYKIVDLSHTSGRWGIYKNIDISPNTSYTVTCTLEGDNCAVGFGFYDSATSFPANVMTVTNNIKKRLSYTTTSGTNSTKARIYLNINCGSSTTKTAWFSLPKLEIGDHSTPWIPNSADPEYSEMGYNSNIEYDVSGYGYNGTKQYITYETDTPRYSVSSVLSGSSTRIPNTTINIGNEWSYGLWFKSAAAARSWEGLVILNNSGGDTDIQLGFYTNPNGSQIQTTANGQYDTISHTYDNKWHHLFATFDGTTLKTYKDGELVNTKTITNSLLSRSNLTIGARRRGEVTFDCPYKGSLSDFRLYATPLSAAQVAELYNTAVSVDNNGTLMGYELVEV